MFCLVSTFQNNRQSRVTYPRLSSRATLSLSFAKGKEADKRSGKKNPMRRYGCGFWGYICVFMRKLMGFYASICAVIWEFMSKYGRENSDQGSVVGDWWVSAGRFPAQPHTYDFRNQSARRNRAYSYQR